MQTAPEVDFLTEKNLSYPFPFFRTALERHPVIKIPNQNMYFVFSNELVKEVLRRHEDFSNDIADFMIGPRSEDPEVKAISSQGWPFVETMITADPPVHTRYRKLVGAAFGKARVQSIESGIRAIAAHLFDEFMPRGRCDFVKEFAEPFPIAVISSEIGLTGIDRSTVRRWTTSLSDRQGGMIDRDREIECARDVLEFQHAMIDIIHRRRVSREDDLLSDLIEASVDGENRLNDVELLSILQQLVAAGNDTAVAAITRGLILLLDNPEQHQAVRQDPALLPNMIDEILRLEAPGQSVFRKAKRDVEIGGVCIPAGAMVMATVAAANRDPAAFARPDAFDVRRQNAATHLSFGRGIHSCVGITLAKAELKIAFDHILTRMDDIRIEEGADLALSPHLATPTLASLPISFTARDLEIAR